MRQSLGLWLIVSLACGSAACTALNRFAEAYQPSSQPRNQLAWYVVLWDQTQAGGPFNSLDTCTAFKRVYDANGIGASQCLLK